MIMVLLTGQLSGAFCG